jgi:hypothetical protein
VSFRGPSIVLIALFAEEVSLVPRNYPTAVGGYLLETILTTRAFSSGESFRAVCATYSLIRFK